jgi:hypothetical protein
MEYHETPWRDYAAPVALNGFSPVVVRASTKEPRFPKWNVAGAGRPHVSFIAKHATRHPADSVGIACGILRGSPDQDLGYLIGVDIDADDPAEATRLEEVAFKLLGPTSFVRTRPGSPRRLLLYRSPEKVKAVKLNAGDLLGTDRQFVAFGRHPDGSYYGWRDASPVTAKAADIPLLNPGPLRAFLEAMGAHPANARSGHGARPRHRQGLPDIIAAGGVGELQWQVEGDRVVDGREALLTKGVLGSPAPPPNDGSSGLQTTPPALELGGVRRSGRVSRRSRGRARPPSAPM